ncbi:hypothetical protein Tco_0527810 [Tanacetum coccineum]
MHTIGMKMKQVQVNTKFLNALPPEWSKFVTDVKLAKMTQQPQAEFPQLDTGLVVPTFQQGEDLVDCINKAMAFLSVVASRFPPSNSQLRTSSNPRNQATIQDRIVTVQQVQGRQTQSFASIRNRGIATTSKGNYAASQPREKLMLAKAQEVGQILDEDQLAFIADPGIAKDVQEMSYSKQTHIVDFPDNEITCDSNIIPYSQYLYSDVNKSCVVECNKCLELETELLKKKDLIEKDTYVQSKEQCASLIAQINAKSVENSDLNAQLQEKVFATAALKNELRKLKGKNVILLFAEPITSSRNIPKQTDSLKTKDSNKPLLTSTRVNPTISASGSKPSGNTKNNRITRPPSSNQKNKVEEHPRNIKSSLNKKNFVSEPFSNALVKHSVRNAKFKSMCVICNKCLFDTNHDMCLVDYVNVHS